MKNNSFTIWLPVPGSYYDSNDCIPAIVHARQGYPVHCNATRNLQPEWKCIGNLGDVNPLDYGGGYVYKDETGIYPPEFCRWESPLETDEGELFKVYRCQCEPCFYTDGVLSNNQFHKNSPAWFARDGGGLCGLYGEEAEELIEMFLSSDPMQNAMAWEMVGEYHGWENLDGYPETYTRAEMEERYKGELA